MYSFTCITIPTSFVYFGKAVVSQSVFLATYYAPEKRGSLIEERATAFLLLLKVPKTRPHTSKFKKEMNE